VNSKALFNRVFLFSCIILLTVFWSTHSHGYRWEKKAVKTYRNLGNSVRQTDDGGYIIAGTTWILGGMYSNVLLIKTDAEGNEVWSKSFRSGDVNRGHSLQRTINGGYIIAGTTWPHGASYSDICLIKTDNDGNRTWYKVFGGKYRDQGYSVRQIIDGGYIIVGSTCSHDNTGSSDLYLIKTDAKGNEVWNRTFVRYEFNCGYSVRQTVDNGYIIVGKTASYGVVGNCEVYLLKSNADGDKIWSKILKMPHK